MRLLIIQYGGDYREAYQRFANGEEEIYGYQKYSVDYVAKLAETLEEVTTICISSKDSYSELLKPKLRAIGLGLKNNYDQQKIKQDISQYIQQIKPDKLILRFPSPEILSLAIKYKISTLTTFSDYIENKTIKQKIKNYFLAKQLNNSSINWVANHGIYASYTLQYIGVNPNKIIPWDWPNHNTSEDFIPKNKPKDNENISILYCGSIIEQKGVTDVIKAINILHKQGLYLTLNMAGNGDIEKFSNLAKNLKIDNQINFLGLINHSQVMSLMRNSDLVIVPSRIECAEGFPKVINEALTCKTPIVASNHPVFVNKLINEVNAMIFPSGDSLALANSIKKVLSNDDLYHKLSLNSAETLLNLEIPCNFGELIDHWLSNTQEDIDWLLQHNLTSNYYI
ncbi:MAG: glycosyltransferase [Cyanobacteria bacterium]|nr:glycosyltransferase [Cyanobacteria bacterium CG_2015-16_32_12]NCO78844.1 glycosyltransferase [Cyanobacteria bacterium CG_2015-22_32_23]NCQ04515.1 glycosyltransferase [Cyanobacteria bacterium CG_2015-09_32_10]NCQ40447.1 glycosyltransferase [Cyanobacteria bacterium CG_2015-04_32_10]